MEDRTDDGRPTHTVDVTGARDSARAPLGECLVPGQMLGERYRIEALLGRGGMGEVWRAFDLKLRLHVALKAARPAPAKDEKRAAMLRAEVRAARDVVSPNVCRIFDLVEVDGRELVSMEYVDGQTLLEVLQERGPLGLMEAQDVASQFLSGLEAIHTAGLVHRDVKPENIMLTRAGRVVVMDFGLARAGVGRPDSVSGTPAYMAPEQQRGGAVDARADVYAAGVVLAEMVSPGGVKSIESRKSVWEGVRATPPKLPETPWAPVLREAVAHDPESRPRSAHTLVRALEAITLRVGGAEEASPYPGLASFTEADTEYFFGREGEVEAMWAGLAGPARLLALVGPSGAGKTSFLRAGVIPAASPEWGVLRCTPGTSAMESLRRVLIPELGGDTEALAELAGGGGTATLAACSRWRAAHDRALLVVDQFEELFTLNHDSVRDAFVDLLHRLPIEADVHVVLSMRDDFLMECQRHEPLRPVISDLMLLDAPRGANLRRALVQPATRCGYRFEDDELVESMLAEVEGERGALPLLAFAAARLWEQRDHENGLLTRSAYESIGRVGGALARHAEHIIDRIGAGRVPIVREVFRNLVTAEGTRAVRDQDDLLSVFGEGERAVAAEVLRELVVARLLTTYEVHDEEAGPTRRVEIIHESLLANWPRLVRWRTQDADAAQLRDQLRQAARTWEEHDRSEDLLWTGSTYREFTLWQERYPGGLSAAEQAFADAMVSHAARRRRRRRMALAGVIVVAAIVATVTTILWRRGVIETRRAQATTLLLKAQTELKDVMSNELALPYAITSLELWDQPAGRRMALRALSLAPPVRLAPPDAHSTAASFSPDGEWLAAVETFDPGEVYVMSSVGGEPRRWNVHSKVAENPRIGVWSGFLSDSVLATFAYRDPVFRLWRVRDGQLLQTLPHLEYPSGQPEDMMRAVGNSRRLIRFVRDADGVWRQNRRGLDRLEQIGSPLDVPAALDASDELLAYADGGDLYVANLGAPDSPPRFVGRIDATPQQIAFSPVGDRIATWEPTRGMSLWSLDGASTRPLRRWAPDKPLNSHHFVFDATGSLLAGAFKGKQYVQIWDLAGPPAAEPWRWSRSRINSAYTVAFDPRGPWLAAPYPSRVALWPVERGRYPYRLHGHTAQVRELTFSPDGSWLVSSAGDGTVRWWPLTQEAGAESRVLFDWGRPWVYVGFPSLNPHFNAVAPDGSWVAVTGQEFDTVNLVSLKGGASRRLRSEGEPLSAVTVDPEGRRLAVAAGAYNERGAILLWDLEADEVTRLDAGGHVRDLQFLPDGSLLDVVNASVRRWNLDTLEVEPIGRSFGGARLTLSAEGRYQLRYSDREEMKQGEAQSVVLADLAEGTIERLRQFGEGHGGWALALSASGRIAVVQDGDSLLVGRTSGGTPRRILARTRVCAISPDERWIATGEESGDILLWPMPDLDRTPLEKLSHDDLLATLKSLTNVRVIRDDTRPDGWGIRYDPFPGWQTVPRW